MPILFHVRGGHGDLYDGIVAGRFFFDLISVSLPIICTVQAAVEVCRGFQG